MLAAGIFITLLGFVLAVLSLGITTDVNVRLAIVLAGMAASLAGIFGVINRVFLKKAIWRK